MKNKITFILISILIILIILSCCKVNRDLYKWEITHINGSIEIYYTNNTNLEIDDYNCFDYGHICNVKEVKFLEIIKK